MTRRNHQWTKSQDKRLLEEWPKRPVAYLAGMLGKSYRVVVDRVRTLRAQGHYVPFKMKKWTKAEDQTLLYQWDKKAIKYVAKDLNRTVDAVKLRIRFLRRRGVEIPDKFRDALYERRWKRFMKLAKKAYKQQTGKDWERE